MFPTPEQQLAETRRYFFGRAAAGLGTAALASCLSPNLFAAEAGKPGGGIQGTNQPIGELKEFHHKPKAKRVIWLFMADGPSQLDLWDYKPKLVDYFDKDLPESIRNGQRITTMTSGQTRFPCAPSVFKFAQHGKHGAWVSELLPELAKIVDDLTIVKTMNTEAINHDPAITFFQTGSQLAGRPSIGSWISYGLGSDNENMPAFTVLLSRSNNGDQPLYARLWGNGFLPSLRQGVQFRSGKEPVLYLNDPPGIKSSSRRRMLDYLRDLNEAQEARVMDPEISSRIGQYEMAYRMQTSVPETMNVDGEPDSIVDLYGPQARIPGTYAANCLLARRLVERGVKFVQLCLLYTSPSPRD